MKRPPRRTPMLAAVLLAGAALLTGCGGADSGSASSAAPEDWKTLKGPTLSLSYPTAFTEQSDAERSEQNDAVATLKEGGRYVALISIQSGFTQVKDAEEAAIAIEASVQSTAELKDTTDVTVEGTDAAKQVDLSYRSTGENQTPQRGATVEGSVITGVDSRGKIFSVRIDAQQGKLSSADRKQIIETISVK
ncbi:hypothetical protein [Streptomyces sp. 7N604]|uniref:hypothetical protein n=1 Tax=Streptomyces sp. 7N604 TaxID=3457415 RepID=UPI003FD4055A